MKELNELIDFYEMTGGEPQLLVMLIELRRHRMDNWKQRAEAAEAALAEEKRINSKLREDRVGLASECNAFEAKLAELEKQEPVVWCNENDLRLMVNKRMIGGMMTVRHHGECPLFIRPAPAINLADLVPDYALRELDGVIDWIKGLPIPTNSATKWLIKMSDLRDDILRNIKEQSQ